MSGISLENCTVQSAQYLLIHGVNVDFSNNIVINPGYVVPLHHTGMITIEGVFDPPVIKKVEHLTMYNGANLTESIGISFITCPVPQCGYSCKLTIWPNRNTCFCSRHGKIDVSDVNHEPRSLLRRHLDERLN